MEIGNKNTGDFRLACILCGGGRDVTLTAFRNRHGKVTGWIVACEDCQPDIGKDYEVTFKRKGEQ